MKAFIAIQLLVTLLAAAVAADSVRGARELKGGHSGDATTTASPNDSVVESSTRATSSKKITEFRQVELSYKNMKPASNGIPYGIGIANVKLVDDLYAKPRYQICITNNVVGFAPTQLHITKGHIVESGEEEVDFTNKLKAGDPICTNCCVGVSQTKFNDIKANPVRRCQCQLYVSPLCQ